MSGEIPLLLYDIYDIYIFYRAFDPYFVRCIVLFSTSILQTVETLYASFRAVSLPSQNVLRGDRKGAFSTGSMYTKIRPPVWQLAKQRGHTIGVSASKVSYIP